jgi:hypothetical protein
MPSGEHNPSLDLTLHQSWLCVARASVLAEETRDLLRTSRDAIKRSGLLIRRSDELLRKLYQEPSE